MVDKNTGAIVKQVQTEAFFCWHHVNAFERAGEVVVDLAAYSDWTIVQGLYLDTMRSDEEYSTMTAEYRRYRISLQDNQQKTVGFEHVIADRRMELPQINYNHYNAKPYQYCYGISTHGNQRDFVNQIVKIDSHATAIEREWYIKGHYPIEAVFAPRPGATAEDDGVLMATIYDSHNKGTYMLILDAHSFDTLATAQLPIRVPFGFHGRWYPNGDMYAL